MISCLLIIDLQNGFLSPQTIHVEALIHNLVEQGLWDLCIFTRFINKPGSPHQRLLQWYKLVDQNEQSLVASLHASAKLVFDKTTYTGLTPDLLRCLKMNGVERVFLCGVDTDCCVLTTAADLFDNNFEVFVLASYCASNGGMESHDAAIRILRRLIGANRVVAGEVDRTRIAEMQSVETTDGTAGQDCPKKDEACN